MLTWSQHSEICQNFTASLENPMQLGQGRRAMTKILPGHESMYFCMIGVKREKNDDAYHSTI
jgi:hypothetical protein